MKLKKSSMLCNSEFLLTFTDAVNFMTLAKNLNFYLNVEFLER